MNRTSHVLLTIACLASLWLAGCQATLPGSTTVPAASTPAPTVIEAPAPSPILQEAASIYVATAQANIKPVGDRLAVVPSPAYANGIYGRDAFYTTLGLEDFDLSEEAYRWFEGAQDPASGQIATAVAFDLNDTSLHPQDDETTIIFLIWSGLMRRQGRPVDMSTVEGALDFVQSHVEGERYVSQPGQFRYWADCYELKRPDTVAYTQGLYALALRSLLDMKVDGVTGDMIEDALDGYRDQFRSGEGFMALSRRSPGNNLQDMSALLPEFLHRYFFGQGMLSDEAVLAAVEHHLETAAIRDRRGNLHGIKIMAQADGEFSDPINFACPTLRNPGDYQNGGHWPLFASVDLALAYSIQPRPAWREALETLATLELADDQSPKEYWELSPGNEGHVQPGRSFHAWNVLIVPALRMAGLVE